MFTILLRLLLIYILLIFTMRVMGKRQIGEMQVSELVTTILLSELAASPITDDQVPILYAIIPVATLIAIEVIISYAVTCIPALKPIFDGKPSILICRGTLDKKELLRVRLPIEELLSQLRIAGIADIADVSYAILEHNGQLSVIPKKHASPPDSDTLKVKPRETGLAHAIVVDTKISDFDLSLIQKDRSWLNSRLAAKKLSLDDILLFTVDDSGEERIIHR